MTTAVDTRPAPPVHVGNRRPGRRARLLRAWPKYLAISPYFLLFTVFGLFPVLFSLYLSFHSWNGLGSIEPVGLDNFRNLAADHTFWLSVRNTIVIWVLSTVPMLLLALIVATMLNSAKRLTTVYRIAYFVPNITSVVAMAVLFGSLFGSNFGLVNAFLGLFGIAPVAWLSTPWAIQATIAILITWQWTGYNAILYLAGMQSISEEVIEAARLDGAGPVRIFTSITMPLLRPIILFTLVVSTITGLQSFTEAQVLTSSSSTTNPNSGGAGQAGLTMVLYFYQQAFNFNRFGYGAAIAWAVFILVLLFTVINWRLARGKDQS